MYNKKSGIVRILAVILVLAMVIPVGASAATGQSRASDYLTSYNAYISLPGSGKVRVYFNVSGTGYMDEIGALSIEIYECSTNSSDLDDWEWKDTFLHDSTSGMLSYNDDYHSGYVTYNGTAGKYYKAYVCIWAGENDDGDTRYFWTSAKKAT